MIKLELYSKSGCHLCDVMKDELNGLRLDLNLEISEISIDGQRELTGLYGSKVPVLLYRGRIIAKYRLDRAKFMNFIKSVKDK